MSVLIVIFQLKPTDDHFRNTLNKSAFIAKEYYENIKKPVDKKE